MKKQQISREELYQEVWSTPMTKLAKKYGISDVGLAKVCKRNNIPKPKAGYWAKMAHGKKVKRRSLPAMENSKPIQFQTSQMKVQIADPAVASMADKLLAFEKLPENRIVTPNEATELHPYTKAVRRGAPWKNVKVSMSFAVPKKLAPRALIIADTLVRALDDRGYLKDGILEEELHFGIYEYHETVMKKSVREYLAANGEKIWSNKAKDFDLIPTGRLSLNIWTGRCYYGGDGLRKNWIDGKKQCVEDCLNDFICGLIKRAAREHDKKLAHERWKRKREEEDRIEDEKAARAAALQAKKDRLYRDADRWQRAEKVRDYVTAHIAKKGTSEWTVWALEEADRIDPLVES